MPVDAARNDVGEISSKMLSTVAYLLKGRTVEPEKQMFADGSETTFVSLQRPQHCLAANP
jgi:hypothetical protein